MTTTEVAGHLSLRLLGLVLPHYDEINMKFNSPFCQIFIHSIPLFYVLFPGSLSNVQAQLDGGPTFSVLLTWVVLFEIALTHNQHYERVIVAYCPTSFGNFIVCLSTVLSAAFDSFFSHHTFFDFLTSTLHIILITLTTLKPCLPMCSWFELLLPSGQSSG